MLVLRRQEELGVQICLRIVQNHIFIAMCGRSGGREGRAGPGGAPPRFSTARNLFKKRHDYIDPSGPQALARAVFSMTTASVSCINNHTITWIQDRVFNS